MDSNRFIFLLDIIFQRLFIKQDFFIIVDKLSVYFSVNVKKNKHLSGMEIVFAFLYYVSIKFVVFQNRNLIFLFSYKRIFFFTECIQTKI